MISYEVRPLSNPKIARKSYHFSCTLLERNGGSIINWQLHCSHKRVVIVVVLLYCYETFEGYFSCEDNLAQK